jgi:CRP-like cAMP-binding protein
MHFNEASPDTGKRVVALATSDVLLNTRFFQGLGQRECSHLASVARTVQFRRDEILFMQGDAVKSLALVLSGKVKLTQCNAHGDDVFMWVSAPGDILGLMAGDPTKTHTCSGTAIEDGRAMVWTAEQMRAFFREFPALSENVSHILSVRLMELEERFREVATEPVARRLACALSRLSETMGVLTQHGVDVRLSREDLARMTGTTLFTVSRVVSRWASEGLVRAGRESLTVIDRKMLQWVALQGK